MIDTQGERMNRIKCSKASVLVQEGNRRDNCADLCAKISNFSITVSVERRIRMEDDGIAGKEITIEEIQGLARFYEKRLETVSDEKEREKVRQRISGLEDTLKKMRAGTVKLSYFESAPIADGNPSLQAVALMYQQYAKTQPPADNLAANTAIRFARYVLNHQANLEEFLKEVERRQR